MENVEVRMSGIHNNGGFAARDISKGELVIEYTGEIISKEEGNRRCKLIIEEAKKNRASPVTYIVELEKFDIDGKVNHNTARYINHSCNPNCKLQITADKALIVAIKDIKKGDELSYNYQFDMEEFELFPCNCGAENCVKFMIDEKYWDMLMVQELHS